jgi:hypothetical protein
MLHENTFEIYTSGEADLTGSQGNGRDCFLNGSTLMVEKRAMRRPGEKRPQVIKKTGRR